jgi:undecaprenyl-phosphate 4-deoxy-4-formamido-L-arabinose transferase
LLFLFVGMQFFGMGLLGEYLGRIYYDVRERPRYIISEVTGKDPFAQEDI